MTWLITGGAGYIGSHVVAAAQRAGINCVIIDDLSTGFTDRIPADVPFYKGDIADRGLLQQILREHSLEGVLHLAARKQVGESVSDPFGYWEWNVARMNTMLQELTSAGVSKVVFSSSAAVYGNPAAGGELDETADCEPINPYGATKLAGEVLVNSLAEIGRINCVSLRYFNVAGAENPVLADRLALNLIPITLNLRDQNKPLTVFGTDYPTADGTCIRDYVHVMDLADAHVEAMKYLSAGATGHTILNVGTGVGSSVLDIVKGLGDTIGSEISWENTGRRAGDPAGLVAKVDRAAEVLNWRAKRNLKDILSSAWDAWPKAN